jgi:hypothetical protein
MMHFSKQEINKTKREDKILNIFFKKKKEKNK